LFYLPQFIVCFADNVVYRIIGVLKVQDRVAAALFIPCSAAGGSRRPSCRVSFSFGSFLLDKQKKRTIDDFPKTAFYFFTTRLPQPLATRGAKIVTLKKILVSCASANKSQGQT